jgi:hypothetical protein
VEVVFQGGIVSSDAATVALKHPSVDGEPASVEGLHLVGDGDGSVQVGIPARELRCVNAAAITAPRSADETDSTPSCPAAARRTRVGMEGSGNIGWPATDQRRDARRCGLATPR